PASWAVVDVAAHPRNCVRFDQHVVYLGGPGENQSCPSWLFGTTEAVLIEPASATARRTSTENPVARQITATAPRGSIPAPFGRNPNVPYTMLARAGLPAPQIVVPNPAALDDAAAGGTTDGTADGASARASGGASDGGAHATVLTTAAGRMTRRSARA